MSSSKLSITRERYIALGAALWHAPDEPAIPEEMLSFGMDRICADIEALTLESEQRLPPPPRVTKARRRQEGRSSQRTAYTDAEWRKVLTGIGGIDE